VCTSLLSLIGYLYEQSCALVRTTQGSYNLIKDLRNPLIEAICWFMSILDMCMVNRILPFLIDITRLCAWLENSSWLLALICFPFFSWQLGSILGLLNDFLTCQQFILTFGLIDDFLNLILSVTICLIDLLSALSCLVNDS